MRDIHATVRIIALICRDTSQMLLLFINISTERARYENHFIALQSKGSFQ